jgi:hypothetical protein
MSLCGYGPFSSTYSNTESEGVLYLALLHDSPFPNTNSSHLLPTNRMIVRLQQPPSLIRRGEILTIGFDVIDNWDVKLKAMNKDKVG